MRFTTIRRIVLAVAGVTVGMFLAARLIEFGLGETVFGDHLGFVAHASIAWPFVLCTLFLAMQGAVPGGRAVVVIPGTQQDLWSFLLILAFATPALELVRFVPAHAMFGTREHVVASAYFTVACFLGRLVQLRFGGRIQFGVPDDARRD